MPGNPFFAQHKKDGCKKERAFLHALINYKLLLFIHHHQSSWLRGCC
jgi:hypothetical protein